MAASELPPPSWPTCWPRPDTSSPCCTRGPTKRVTRSSGTINSARVTSPSYHCRPARSRSKPRITLASYRAYEWLKRQPRFDVVQFPDIGGLGFYSMQAKRLGLAFMDTVLYVVLHSPTLWHRLENREAIDDEQDLALEHLERRSVEWADALVSPSRYLLDWVKDWGFRLPAQVLVHPYASHRSEFRAGSGRAAVSEIAFFGRLETRKGLEVFCAALEILASEAPSTGVQSRFSANPGVPGSKMERPLPRVAPLTSASLSHRGGPRPGQSVGQPAPQRSARSHAITGRQHAVHRSRVHCRGDTVCRRQYRRHSGNCCRARLRRHALCSNARGAAQRLERALRDGVRPARSAHDPNDVRRRWIGWHELLAERRGPEAPSGMPPVLPLVSVCMATRNRATIAAQALESLRSQSYRNIEIVLVDDASDAPDARAWLDQIEPEFEQSGWRIIRRSTRGLPSAARNFAASMARGEYLLFMDDDNIARPAEIETFVRAALHSGAPVLTCVVEHFRHEQDGADPRPFLRWLPLGGATAYGLISNKFGDTNMLVRKDVFHRLGRVRERRTRRLAVSLTRRRGGYRD